jgi:hypothetical protein
VQDLLRRALDTEHELGSMDKKEKKMGAGRRERQFCLIEKRKL